MHFCDNSINIQFVISTKENMQVSLFHNLTYKTRMRIVNYSSGAYDCYIFESKIPWIDSVSIFGYYFKFQKINGRFFLESLMMLGSNCKPQSSRQMNK
jgi:hypothetical protein